MVKAFFISLLFGFCLSSCSTLSNKHKINKLTQVAIFQYLSLPTSKTYQKFSKGSVKLDPLLCIRDTISYKDTLYFDKQVDLDILKQPVPNKFARLIIPDSLALKFRYTEKNCNWAQEYASVYQFSSLLPTTKSNIFLIQYYIWSNTCSDYSDTVDTLCCRTAIRGYLKFIVKWKRITFLEPLASSDEASDFIGLRCFSRRRLLEKFD
jgi:hypothetical protein